MGPQIISVIGIIVGILLAIVVGKSIGGGGMMIPLFSMAIPMFFVVLALSGWQPIALAFFCITLAGSVPIAKGLTPFNIIAVAMFVWFVIESVVFRKRNLAIRNAPMFGTLFLICCILLINFIAGGGGIRIFGASTWGGRRYFEVIVAMMFYVVLTLWKPDMKALNKIPFFVLLAALFDSGFWAMQYLKPGLIAYTYQFYTGLQSDLFFADANAAIPTEGVERLMGFRTLGLGLVLYCVSAHNFKNLLAPKSILYGVLIVVGIGLTTMAGFRSYVAVALLMAAIGGFLRLKTLAIVPALISVLFVACLAIGQGSLYELPVQVQRSLSFLPGNWDSRAVNDATGSTEWRQGIWKLWYDQYFFEHPIIGRGWNIDPSEAYGAGLTGLIIEKPADAWQFHAAIGSLHNGPLTAIDAVGIIGFILAILATMLILTHVWGHAARIGFMNLQPVHRWVILSLMAWLFTFWVVDGFFHRFMPYFIVLCGLAVQAFSLTGKKEPEAEQSTPTPDPCDLAKG